MAGEDKAAALVRAFEALAADQVRDLSDEDLALHTQATVAMLEAIDAEWKRRTRPRCRRPQKHPAAQGPAQHETAGQGQQIRLTPTGCGQLLYSMNFL